ncbi:MAG: hypothetical protein K2O67_03040, partial [Clostridia bacterium]|nr:hypothetical protein [Clostridia bacterium]
GEVTSLSSYVSAVIFLQIERKQIAFDWTAPEDSVYDGTEKTVTVGFDRSQLVENETLNYSIISGLDKQYTAKNAGTYPLGLAVGGYPADFYDCYKVENQSYNFVIARRPAQVNWSNTNFVYNAQTQSPTASATGAPVDGELTITVSASGRNAGTYTATATTANANYTLTGASIQYKIDKKPLTITAQNVIVGYGKTAPQRITITNDQCAGFEGADRVSSLSGTAWESYEGKDVGVYPEGVKIWGLSSNNYDIEYINGQLTIGQCAVQIDWAGTENLIYDGTPKNVTAVVSNKGYADDDIRLIVTGGTATDAGEYTAEVVDLEGASAGNYSLRISGNKSKVYNIAKAKVKITAQNKTSVYGDELAELTATVQGTIYNDELQYTLVKTAGENAGTYTISVNVSAEGKSKNYDVQTVNGTYTIEKRVAYVKWLTESQRTFTYDGKEHSVFSEGSDSYAGFLEKDLPYVHVHNFSATEAGEYIAYVTLDSEIAGNYNLAAQECKWEIKEV